MDINHERGRLDQLFQSKQWVRVNYSAFVEFISSFENFNKANKDIVRLLIKEFDIEKELKWLSGNWFSFIFGFTIK